MIKFAQICVILISLAGCAGLTFDPSAPPTASEIAERSKYFRRDLRVKVNGTSIVGVGVIPRAEKYDVTVSTETSIDRIIWRTCGRQEVVDKKQGGWFSQLFGSSSDSYRFTYQPMRGLEDQNACPLSIEVFTAKKTKVGFALIDFSESRPEYNIISTMKCNGSTRTMTGVGICQTATDIEQEFRFDRPVKVARPMTGCNPMKESDPNRQVYRLRVSQGECLYNFGSEDGSWFRLTTMGYNEVPFRGE